MSTYNFRCLDCGGSFTVDATIREKEEHKGSKFICPKCRSENVNQEFSITNFIKNVFGSDSNKSEKETSCCGPKKGGGCCGN